MKEHEPGTFWYFINHVARSPGDGKIAGICSGLSHLTPVPAWVWRAIFLISLFFGGVGLIVYLILWIVMPTAIAKPPDKNF